MQRSMEEHWRARFEETAQTQEDDHAIAIWSREGMEAHLQAFFQNFQRTANAPQAVLDIGCGSGIYSRTLTASGHHPIGMDFTIPMLYTARNKAVSEGHRFPITGGDIYNLPFRDAVFDSILCSGVIQTLTEEDIAFQEITRVLKPGGHLFIMTRNALFPKNEATDRSGQMKSYDPFHLQQRFVDMGYRPIRIESIFILRGRRRYLRPFANRLRHVTALTRPFLKGAEGVLIQIQKNTE